MTVNRAAAVLSAAVVLAACGGTTPATPGPTGAAATASIPSAAPTATAGPDTAALLAAKYDQVTSAATRLEGTIVIGNVQATFAGTSTSNGPDESSTLTTTVGSQASTEQHVRVAGTRYVQRGIGPWLVDTSSSSGGGGSGAALKAALKVATDLDAGATGVANHRVETTEITFDPVAWGFAKSATGGRATYAFLAEPDGTPVSVSIAATWTQPGETDPVAVQLDLTLTFSGLNTKPRIAAPAPVWQAFASERWAYAVAYPTDYDYSKEKTADYFIAPTSGLVTIGRNDALGYTLNQIATAELGLSKKTLKSKTGTNEAATLGGEKARFLSVAGTNDGVKVTTFEILAVHGKYLYAIVWFAEAGDDDAQRATFLQLISTFKFS
jgi:hypothetical protein